MDWLTWPVCVTIIGCVWCLSGALVHVVRILWGRDYPYFPSDR